MEGANNKSYSVPFPHGMAAQRPQTVGEAIDDAILHHNVEIARLLKLRADVQAKGLAGLDHSFVQSLSYPGATPALY